MKGPLGGHCAVVFSAIFKTWVLVNAVASCTVPGTCLGMGMGIGVQLPPVGCMAGGGQGTPAVLGGPQHGARISSAAGVSVDDWAGGTFKPVFPYLPVFSPALRRTGPHSLS